VFIYSVIIVFNLLPYLLRNIEDWLFKLFNLILINVICLISGIQLFLTFIVYYEFLLRLILLEIKVLLLLLTSKLL